MADYMATHPYDCLLGLLDEQVAMQPTSEKAKQMEQLLLRNRPSHLAFLLHNKSNGLRSRTFTVPGEHIILPSS